MNFVYIGYIVHILHMLHRPYIHCVGTGCASVSTYCALFALVVNKYACLTISVHELKGDSTNWCMTYAYMMFFGAYTVHTLITSSD